MRVTPGDVLRCMYAYMSLRVHVSYLGMYESSPGDVCMCLSSSVRMCPVRCVLEIEELCPLHHGYHNICLFVFLSLFIT